MYAFRFVEPWSGQWVRARYRAEIHVIMDRYRQWEIVGRPEIHTRTDAAMFSPSSKLPPRAHLPIEEPPDDPSPEKPPDDDHPVEEPPPIEDQLERFLVLVFLRRYVTWCARRRRFDRIPGAAALYRRINHTSRRIVL
jgi:hypothetical protein